MKNIETILKEIGIEIPGEKTEDFKKAFNENYKTVAEYSKMKDNLDATKDQLNTTQNALKGFEGLDAEALKKEVADWKQKADDAQKSFDAKIAERDYNDAINSELGNYKFSSYYAKRAITEKVKSAGLKLDNGKIMGLNDYMEQIKAEDASAFAIEEPQNTSKPMFTARKEDGAKKMTKDEILSIKNRDERLAAIANNKELFGE